MWFKWVTAHAALLSRAHIWIICLLNRRINRFNRGFGRRLKRQVLELKLYRLLILILKFKVKVRSNFCVVVKRAVGPRLLFHVTSAMLSWIDPQPFSPSFIHVLLETEHQLFLRALGWKPRILFFIMKHYYYQL